MTTPTRPVSADRFNTANISRPNWLALRRLVNGDTLSQTRHWERGGEVNWRVFNWLRMNGYIRYDHAASVYTITPAARGRWEEERD